MKSSELMNMAEEGSIQKDTIVIDQEGNEFVFTGKSFQLLDWGNRDKDKFYGLCVGDNWTITDEVACEDCCLTCGHSFSTKDDRLMCVLTDEHKEVMESDYCDEFN